jgi:hypothetical protein
MLIKSKNIMNGGNISWRKQSDLDNFSISNFLALNWREIIERWKIENKKEAMKKKSFIVGRIESWSLSKNVDIKQ